MIKAGGGAIVNVASGRGVQGDLGLPAYGASKAALINLTLNVATQYGKQGIRANSIVVGMVITPSVEAATSPEMIALFTGHHLTPHVATPKISPARSPSSPRMRRVSSPAPRSPAMAA